MTQQGWPRGPHSGRQDDWWSQLYDPGSPDTGRSRSGDTLDDRYASVRRTMGPSTAPGRTPPGRRVAGQPVRGRDAEPSEERKPSEEQGPHGGPGADAEPPPDPRADGALSQQAPPVQEPRPEPTGHGTEAVEAPEAGEDDDLAEPLRVPLRPDHIGERPPTYEAEPATFPAADSSSLSELVPDTVLDGAHYGGLTLRAASLRGDSARHRGALRRDALLTARFGSGESALLLVAVAAGGRAATGGHRAAREIGHAIGGVVGRSHARLAEDIRADRRGALKSGLQRLTERCYGKLRAQAAALGMQPEEYTADLRCLLLSADPRCRTRVFFGSGAGGLFRLRSGAWHDVEAGSRGPGGGLPGPVAGSGSGTVAGPGTDADPGTDDAVSALDPSELGDPAALSVPMSGQPGTQQSDATLQLGRSGVTGPPTVAEAAGPAMPPVPPPVRPAPEPFRFCATEARRGDTLLLCSPGLAEPLRAEPAFAQRLAQSWSERAERTGPPGLAAFLADVQLRVRGYADDRTAVAVWEG